MRNILVTGGLGFIGSHYAKLMVNSGYIVTIIDNNTYAADIERIKDIKEKVKLYTYSDICDYSTCKEVISNNDIDTIVNFAASTHVDNSIVDSKEFICNNIEGVQNLLEFVRRKNIRFIQISTDEVYGSTLYNDQTFKETDKLNPGNPYAASKASADLLTLSYFNTYKIDCCITRSSNNYGSGQHIEKFIPRMIMLGKEGKDLEIYGNGNNIRDWLYVEDNCNAIKLVMEKGIKGEIYNICSYEEKTNNEIANVISNKFGVGIKYIEDRKGHDYRYSINCNKIWDEFGWDTKTSFEEGIEKTIEWYKSVI